MAIFCGKSRVDFARGFGFAFILSACLMGTLERARAQGSAEKISVNDVDRSYVLHLPTGYDAKSQHYPLVILLHGTEQTAEDMERLTRFDDLADRMSVIAVYPNGLRGRWNVGLGSPEPYPRYVRRRRYYGGPVWGGPYPPYPPPPPRQAPARERNRRAAPADDIEFINQLIDQLSSQYSVDTTRVYVTGLSDGGFMAFRLGCAMADRIAAIAPVGAAMPKTMMCVPSHPVSVLMINGTSDPVVKYGGSSGRPGVPPTISVEDSAKHWAQGNTCAAKPAKTKIKGKKGGMDTEVRTYEGCDQKGQVVLYSVQGGGNTWPCGQQYQPEKVIGKTSFDLNADEVIWGFFVGKRSPGEQKSNPTPLPGGKDPVQ